MPINLVGCVSKGGNFEGLGMSGLRFLEEEF